MRLAAVIPAKSGYPVITDVGKIRGAAEYWIIRFHG
jgi:hypothetical protein